MKRIPKYRASLCYKCSQEAFGIGHQQFMQNLVDSGEYDKIKNNSKEICFQCDNDADVIIETDDPGEYVFTSKIHVSPEMKKHFYKIMYPNN